jgi:L-threonylcarbamoyladenylate synthase
MGTTSSKAPSPLCSAGTLHMKLPSLILADSQQTRGRAAETIERGGVIAFRTDTLYGLGADPFNHKAVKRIQELKGTEDGKPILIVISDQDQVERFIAERSKAFALLAARFWPGPLTLIGKACAGVPDEITAKSGTVGVRLPDDEEVRALVRACGGALTATSANPSGDEPARTAQQVAAYFGDRIDLIIEGGQAQTDRPSTVVNASANPARLIREGVIARDGIDAVLRKIEAEFN